MMKAILFDCFGVLVGQGFAATYAHAGGDPESDRAFIDDVLGQANLGMASEDELDQRVAENIGISVAQWRQAVRETEHVNRPLIDDIKTLKSTYKIGLLSNANKGLVQKKLGHDIDLFDEVVVSGEVGLVKPQPEIYRLACKRLGVEPSEVLFVDDIQEYVDAAKKVGLHAVLYLSLQRLQRDIG